MKSQKEIKSSSWTYYVLIVFLWIVNTAFSLIQNNTEALARYDISESYLQIVKIIFAFPVLILWLAVAYSAINFWEYARSIWDSKDGKGFRYISIGLFLIFLSFLFSTYISQFNALLGELKGSSVVRDTYFIIIRNYLSIGFSLVSFLYIYLGSRKLIESIEVKTNKIWNIVLAWIPTIIAGVVFVVLLFQNAYRTVSDNPLISPTYALSDGMIIGTIVIPYLISWLFGLLALSNILIFNRKNKGILYKKILLRFVVGISFVIVLSVLLSFVSQFSVFWSQVGFNSILIILAGIYAWILVGYMLVASGAKKLHRLESL